MANRKRNYLKYTVAKQYMADHHPDVKSRQKYIEWHQSENPVYIPRYPHRVYNDFSWNDFLQTTNSFEEQRDIRRGRKRHYRDYWEAVRYAQAQAKHSSISTQREWEEWYDTHIVPDDIPKRPIQVYPDFSWKVWLGKNINAALATADNAVAIVGLHHVLNEPDNVVRLKVWTNGVVAMKQGMLDGLEGRAYGMWKYEKDVMAQVVGVMDRFGHKRATGYVVPNIHSLLWELNSLLEIVQVKQ